MWTLRYISPARRHTHTNGRTENEERKKNTGIKRESKVGGDSVSSVLAPLHSSGRLGRGLRCCSWDLLQSLLQLVGGHPSSQCSDEHVDHSGVHWPHPPQLLFLQLLLFLLLLSLATTTSVPAAFFSIMSTSTLSSWFSTTCWSVCIWTLSVIYTSYMVATFYVHSTC